MTCSMNPEARAHYLVPPVTGRAEWQLQRRGATFPNAGTGF
jgi:hypothetical protein